MGIVASNNLSYICGQQLPSQLIYLDASKNCIKTIETCCFKTNFKLRVLHLEQNYISLLETDAFVELKHLELINLSENNFVHLPYIF